MRLIDADKLYDDIVQYRDENMLGGGNLLVDDILEDINLSPTVDAEPVRHGKWERTDITEESGWALYRCSCCNWHTTYYYSFSASPTYNFCPNCGAKMEVNDYGA